MASENLHHSGIDEIKLKQLTNWNTQNTVQDWNTTDFLSVLSTHFLICTEKIQGSGEDCGLEAFNQNAGLIGVFDGCGGLGARICPSADNKTEAYLASRTIGNAVKLWFDYCCDARRWDLKLLDKIILIALEHCKKYSSSSSSFSLKGSLIKPYPSTMAVVVSYIKQKKILTTHLWAGDSRTFFLDANGLAQISTDDINGGDALDNLTQDGALTNVISLGGKFIVHHKTIAVERPAVIISATDGCFGYVASPMAFEFILLSSLMNSNHVEGWRENLRRTISSVSGDDQTIAIEAIGFETFSEMKESFLDRYKYIEKIEQFSEAKGNDNIIRQLWKEYKPNYYRFNV